MKPCMNLSNETMMELSRGRGRMEAWVDRFAKYPREDVSSGPTEPEPLALPDVVRLQKQIDDLKGRLIRNEIKLQDHITIAVNASKKKQVKQDSLYRAKDVS